LIVPRLFLLRADREHAASAFHVLTRPSVLVVRAVKHGRPWRTLCRRFFWSRLMLQTRFPLALVWGVVAASFATAQSLAPAAPAARSLAESQFADAVRALRLEVTLACIDVLAARATRTLVAANLRTFEDLANVNRARVVAGSIAPFESTRSDVAMLQFRSTVVRADLDLAAATARLRTLLGRSASDPLDLVGDLGGASAATASDVERLEQVAL